MNAIEMLRRQTRNAIANGILDAMEDFDIEYEPNDTLEKMRSEREFDEMTGDSLFAADEKREWLERRRQREERRECPCQREPHEDPTPAPRPKAKPKKTTKKAPQRTTKKTKPTRSKKR